MKTFNQFENYCKAINDMPFTTSTRRLLIVRANNLRTSMDDGVVQETSAIKHLHLYAKDLLQGERDWVEMRNLMAKYDEESLNRGYDCSPQRAITKRDGLKSTDTRALENAARGMVEHSLHIPNTGTTF